MVNFHGLGHLAAIHTKDEKLLKNLVNVLVFIRIIWNSPSIRWNRRCLQCFLPSLTLGCGSYGKNSVGK